MPKTGKSIKRNGEKHKTTREIIGIQPKEDAKVFNPKEISNNSISNKSLKRLYSVKTSKYISFNTPLERDFAFQ